MPTEKTHDAGERVCRPLESLHDGRIGLERGHVVPPRQLLPVPATAPSRSQRPPVRRYSEHHLFDDLDRLRDRIAVFRLERRRRRLRLVLDLDLPASHSRKVSAVFRPPLVEGEAPDGQASEARIRYEHRPGDRVLAAALLAGDGQEGFPVLRPCIGLLVKPPQSFAVENAGLVTRL